MLFYWGALLIAAFANVVANVAFKSVMRDVPAPLGAGAFVELALAPRLWLGLVSAVLLLGCFLVALRGIDLSVAYPAITGLATVGVIVAGYLLFSESLTLAKIAGAGFVCLGIAILSQA